MQCPSLSENTWILTAASRIRHNISPRLVAARALGRIGLRWGETLSLEVVLTLLALIRLRQPATEAACRFPPRRIHRVSLRSRPKAFLQLLQGSRPILFEKPRQRSVSQQFSPGLACRTIVGFVLCM